MLGVISDVEGLDKVMESKVGMCMGTDCSRVWGREAAVGRLKQHSRRGQHFPQSTGVGQ